MGTSSRSFKDDYKRLWVDLVASGGRSIGSVPRKLGCEIPCCGAGGAAGAWAGAHGGEAAPNRRRRCRRRSMPQIARLQRENGRLGRVAEKTVKHRGAPARLRNCLLLSYEASRLEVQSPLKNVVAG